MRVDILGVVKCFGEIPIYIWCQLKLTLSFILMRVEFLCDLGIFLLLINVLSILVENLKISQHVSVENSLSKIIMYK